MRVLPMGPSAVIVEDPPGGPVAWTLGLRLLGVEGLVDVVPAARTVMVRCDSPETVTSLRDSISLVVPGGDHGPGADHVTISVVYDGDDLHEVAKAVGLTTDEVIELHSGATYEVAFCGFAPGFGYLDGLPGQLHLPRRATPRTRVPAGSVAIAAEYSAVYPRESPGGWHLLGTATQSLFDVDRDPPALLRPGTTVRFEPA